MREDRGVPKYSPPTLRSRRLGRELTRLRGEAGLSLRQATARVRYSDSWLSRVESGELKIRPGGVMELLRAYGVALEGETAKDLLEMAEHLNEPGWWQRMGTLSPRYLTYISFEDDATRLRNFEPMLIPGLLQTEAYARAVVSVGRETNDQAIEQRLRARLERQKVLNRESGSLRLHAIISEAALLCEVGGLDVMKEQMTHIVEMAARPNIRVQALRFGAGAHLAERGGFAVLSFAEGDPDLGHIETPTGALFLEDVRDIQQLTTIFDDLVMRSMSPKESIALIRTLGNTDVWPRLEKVNP